MGVYLLFGSIFLAIIIKCSCEAMEPTEQHWKDYTYIDKTKSFYKIHRNPTTWLKARDVCETEDALLFYPENYREAEVIRDWWEIHTGDDMSTLAWTWIHIGLMDMTAEKHFETVDGLPISFVYDNWHAGEPNSHKNEDCVDLSFGLTLVNTECNATENVPRGPRNSYIPFVCKKKLDDVMIKTRKREIEETTTEKARVIEKHWNDYTYQEETQSFYKMHKEYKSWVEAKEICEEEGALLFYPEDFREAKMIKDWWSKNTDEDMTPRVRTWIHVGFTDMNYEDQYETVDGIPIDQVYDKWHPGEPNNYNNEDCVDLLYNLNLMDSECNATESHTRGPWDSHIPFVCKKKLSEVVKEMTEKYVYKEETMHEYKVHSERKPWVEAKAICDGEGGLLFYPENREEAEMVKEMFENLTATVLDEPDENLFHIGLTDREKEGEFVTVDGRPIIKVYHNWAPGEPNDGSHKQNCVQMRNDLMIDDSECDRVKGSAYNHLFVSPFVCKRKPGQKPKPIKIEGEHWKDYTYKEQTSSYYKMHKEYKSWIDAKKICEGEDALLFYPEDFKEAKMIRDWWSENTDEDMTPRVRTWIHVGLTDMFDEDEYETVDGIPIDQVYDKWHPGEPNNYDNEDCVDLLYNLNLMDSECNATESVTRGPWDSHIPFVCKKTQKDLEKKPIEVEEQHWKDYTYKKQTQSFYKMHKTYKSWMEAKKICESEDALLFYPESYKEAKMIRDWWSENTDEDMTPRVRTWIHVGLTDMFDEDQYETVDGIPIGQVYDKWHPGEPNNYNNEDCVDLLYNLNLMDSECNATESEHRGPWDSHIPFVCKKKLEDVTGVTWQPIIDGDTTATYIDTTTVGSVAHTESNNNNLEEIHWKDYTFKELTKSFYKMHKTHKSWLEAKNICETEDAVLFYPESVSEAKMVRDWWSQNTDEDMTPRVRTWIHVGFTDMNEEDEYETVDGVPLSEVYDKWHPGEPNNYNNEDCVDLLYNLNLMDSECNATESVTRGPWDSHIPFVCKKKLEVLLNETSTNCTKSGNANPQCRVGIEPVVLCPQCSTFIIVISLLTITVIAMLIYIMLPQITSFYRRKMLSTSIVPMEFVNNREHDN